MEVKALILNHCDDEGNTSREPRVRDVTIPPEATDRWDKADDLGKLELVFFYGQNDHSISFPEYNTTYSLSVGDVVCLVKKDSPEVLPIYADYTYYVVCGAGFNHITSDELNALMAMPTGDRAFCELVQGK